MNAKSIVKLLLVVAGLGLAAVANTVPVQFVSSASNLGGPASNGVYYYPYQLIVNGATVTVACDDYDNSVYLNEKWNASVNTFADLSNTLYGSGAQTQYEKAAWLYSQFLPTPPLNDGINAAINWAIWDIMDPDTPTYNGANSGNGYNQQYNSSYWVTQAGQQNLAGLAGSGYFNDFVIYTPVNGWPSSDGMPQEYIGEVPEPGTIVLLLTGLLGLCCMAWKRKTLLN
jgi:hypothetical protein